MRHVILLVALGAGALAGCAGRDPVLEATMTPADTEYDCQELHIAYEDAVNRALSKQATQESRDNADALLGVTGAVLFWPALFFIDTKNAEGIEARNLLQRGETLRQLAANRSCDTSAWQPLPEIRYGEPPPGTVVERPETRLNGEEVAEQFTGESTRWERGALDGRIVTYVPGGSLDGHATDDSAADSGAWAVEDDRLCMRWEVWDDARRRRFGVYGRGEGEYRLNPGGGRTNVRVTIVDA